MQTLGPTPSPGWWTRMTVLMLTLWTTCCASSSGSGGGGGGGGLQDAGQFQRSLAGDDRIYTAPGAQLLWADIQVSVTSCATVCFTDQMCVGFTASRTGAGTVECRGHRCHPTEGGVTHPGARLYLLSSRLPPPESFSTAQSPSVYSDTSAAAVDGLQSSLQTPSHDVTTTPGQTPSHDVTTTPGQTTSHDVTTTPGQTTSHDVTTTPGQTTSHDVTTTPGQTTSHDVTTTPGQTTSHDVTTTPGQTTSHDVTTTPGQTTSHDVTTTPGQTTSHGVTTTQDTAWLRRVCSSNADCGAQNSECFKGQCLCTPGYFYSDSTAFCLHACPSDQLQSLVLTYQGYHLLGYVLDGVLTDLSLRECVQSCVNSASAPCPSADYWLSRHKCAISNVSRFDVDSSRWVNNSDFYYFQRTCA